MAITNSVQPQTLVKASTAWPDSMIEADFMPEYGVMTAIKAEDTSRIQMLAPLPDQADASIIWLNQCDLTTDTCVDNVCTFDGPSVSSFVQSLTIDQCVQTEFSEAIDRWRDNIYGLGDAEAINLNKVMKSQLEYVSQYAVGVINANTGTNEHIPFGSTWTGTDPVTIPAAAFNTGIYGQLLRNARKNRLDNPYLLTGEALAHMNYLAQTNGGNGEGAGDALRARSMRIYEDLFNIDEVNDPALMFYMINRGALAFASRGYFPRTAETLDGNYSRFSIPNRWFPDLIHDVERVVSCTTGTWSVNYRVKARYKVLVNPTGCTAGRTGILSYLVEAGV